MRGIVPEIVRSNRRKTVFFNLQNVISASDAKLFDGSFADYSRVREFAVLHPAGTFGDKLLRPASGIDRKRIGDRRQELGQIGLPGKMFSTRSARS